MTELPSGWASTTLGEIAPLRYGKSLTEALRTGTGPVLVYGSSGLIGKHDIPLIEHETVVVGRKGTVGAVYHVTEPSWVIDTAYFVEDSDNLNWRYIY
jgi:type I restriction enzyme S subunit